jgi:hypothetical protein
MGLVVLCCREGGTRKTPLCPGTSEGKDEFYGLER